MSSVVETPHDHDHGLVAHHFENLDQQRDANALGMWLFLGSEILFFGAVFTAYAVMRTIQGDGFTPRVPTARRHARRRQHRRPTDEQPVDGPRSLGAFS